MNKNPYTVLGVSENASDEEIRKAYRELVKKYHPDKYANSDLSELANEKMQEVNSAYDEIQKMRKSDSNGYSSSYNSSNSSNSSYGGYSGSSTSSDYTYIRNCINARKFNEAMNCLEGIDMNDRGAEWNFLMGCTLMGMRRTFDASGYFETAHRMNPSNPEYAAAYNRMRNVSFNGYNTSRQNNGCSAGCLDCDTCCTCLCLDSLCECFGGDLIPCC